MAKATAMQKIAFNIPATLLEQIEETTKKLDLSRSEFIRRALEAYLEEQDHQELRESLKEGYLVHAESSRRLAEEFYVAEQEAWDNYS